MKKKTSIWRPSSSFSDISEHLWAAAAIEATQNAGFMMGYQDGTYRAEVHLTRAEGRDHDQSLVR